MNLVLKQGSRPVQQMGYFPNNRQIPTFPIYVHYDREGSVWCASSDEIPGLNIEGETREDAENEAVEWATDLLADNHIVPPYTKFRLTFIRES